MWFINQIDINLGILKITNEIYLVEAILLSIIITIQLGITVKTWVKINDFKRIFDRGLKVKKGFIDKKELKINSELISKIQFEQLRKEEDNEKPKFSSKKFKKIAIIEADGENTILIKIKNALNQYLIRNFGAVVNFSIIKDIIGREVENKDEEISHSLPTPLYLGLGATMIGIIFGLWAIPDMSEASGESGTQEFAQMINPLIDGVKIAMISSMIGLIFTTILSSFKYKSAKRHIQNKINDQLTLLETELLPELYEAEDSGVSGLKSSLDDFSRKATEVVSQVDNAIQKSYFNIQSQQDLIKRVEQLDISKISRLNIEVFGHLEKNLVAFESFSKYLDSMEQIASNLKHFASRSNNVDQIANQIYETLTDSNKLTRFLTNHFEQIEKLSENAVKAVSAAGGNTINAFNLAESNFKQAIEKLEEEINNRIQLLNIKANRDESNLMEIYNKIGSELHRISSEHLNSFRKSYTEAVPKFEQLDNLKELPPIREKIGQNTQILQQSCYENNSRLIESLNQLNKNLEHLISSKNNQQLLQKLIDIENKLGKNGRGKQPRTIVTPKPISEPFIKISIPKFLQRRKRKR